MVVPVDDVEDVPVDRPLASRQVTVDTAVLDDPVTLPAASRNTVLPLRD